jgi:tetraacyldisaccharide 4'-kinase
MGIVNAWYRKSPWLYLLMPFSVVYRFLARRRRTRLEEKRHIDPSWPPIVVIGNITVGGTGKTPLIISLVRALRNLGLQPGIVSRGYGGHPAQTPCEVTALSSVEEMGDEAVMIRRSVDCPMVVDPNRVRAINALLKVQHCDVILSDDGLQHYAMARDLEVVVLDGERLFGNGLRLPAGPLREGPNRLREVDYVVVNGGEREHWQSVIAAIGGTPTPYAMSVRATQWVNMNTGARLGLSDLPVAADGFLHAMAGIGNPQRFFNIVRELGYEPLCHPFPDHYSYAPQDLAFNPTDTVVMTQKDAVKCERFATENYWYLDIELDLEDSLSDSLIKDIQALVAKRAAASSP